MIKRAACCFNSRLSYTDLYTQKDLAIGCPLQDNRYKALAFLLAAAITFSSSIPLSRLTAATTQGRFRDELRFPR